MHPKDQQMPSIGLRKKMPAIQITAWRWMRILLAEYPIFSPVALTPFILMGQFAYFLETNHKTEVGNIGAFCIVPDFFRI